MKKIIFFPIFILLAFHSSFAQIPTSGLVAEYTFNDGTGAETNPNGHGPNNAVLINTTATTDRFGNANYAQDMNGLVTTYINLGTSSLLTPTTGTISMWVNVDAISSQGYGYDYNPIILAKNNNAPGSYMEGYAMSIRRSNSKHLTLTTNPPTNEKYFFSSSALALDRWYHMVMTYDNSNLCAYVRDTALVWSNCITKGFTSTFHAGDSVVVGNSANASNKRALDGLVDDIRIYNRVLTSTEILALFEEENPIVPAYVEVTKNPNGGYVQLTDSKVRFTFQQNYGTPSGGEIIEYKIYSWNRQEFTNSTFTTNYGFNAFNINVSSLAANSYYTLEFKANKGESYVVKFKTKP